MPVSLPVGCCYGSKCMTAALHGAKPHHLLTRRLSRNQEELFCDEFHLVDLRVFDNCQKVVKGCEHVFNLAADMGGMGFIQSNHSVIMYNNTMISFNVLEVSRIEGVKRCCSPLALLCSLSSSDHLGGRTQLQCAY